MERIIIDKSVKPVKVLCDGKLVGKIKKVADGWQYFPLHQKQGGEIYPTMDLVVESLKL